MKHNEVFLPVDCEPITLPVPPTPLITAKCTAPMLSTEDVECSKPSGYKYGTVSYYHRDGNLHKGFIGADTTTIIVKNDSKLGTMEFENVTTWIKELETFLPVFVTNTMPPAPPAPTTPPMPPAPPAPTTTTPRQYEMCDLVRTYRLFDDSPSLSLQSSTELEFSIPATQAAAEIVKSLWPSETSQTSLKRQGSIGTPESGTL